VTTSSFQVGNATFGDGRLTIIAGPCVIESAEHALMMARECSARAKAAGVDFVFKSSFDKANRSSIQSFRGLGMEAGAAAAPLALRAAARGALASRFCVAVCFNADCLATVPPRDDHSKNNVQTAKAGRQKIVGEIWWCKKDDGPERHETESHDRHYAD